LKQVVYIIIASGFSILSQVSVAQKENMTILRGNRYYKEKQLDQAKAQYQKALEQAPGDPAANYNLGNVHFRKNNFDEAIKSYEQSFEHSTDNTIKEKGLYNSGVAWIKQQKLPESIDSWKKALKLDPADEDARENLQKALLELEKKQPKQQKNEQKEEKKKQNQQNQNQPKPQQSKLTKQQVEQLLKALQQKEKEVQEKMNQNKVKSLSQPDKDW
jgi:Ca-activated chloride channel homolog